MALDLSTIRTVSDIPDGFDFVNDSQDVAPLREYFVDASEYDSFFVRIENCAYVAGFGMHGVIPTNSKRVYALESRESQMTRVPRTTPLDALRVAVEMLEAISKGKSFDSVEYMQKLEGMRALLPRRAEDDDAASTAARHEELLAGLVGRVAHSRIREANTGRAIMWTYTETGGMLDVYWSE